MQFGNFKFAEPGIWLWLGGGGGEKPIVSPIAFFQRPPEIPFIAASSL